MKAKSGVLCVIVKVIFVIFWPRAFHCQTQAFSDLSLFGQASRRVATLRQRNVVPSKWSCLR